MNQAHGQRYDRFPALELPESVELLHGEQLWQRLRTAAHEVSDSPLIVIDTYPGADLEDIEESITRRLPEFQIVNIEEFAALEKAELDAMLSETLTSDPVFGVMSDLSIDSFYDQGRLAKLGDLVATDPSPSVLIGWGAERIATRPHVRVLADMPRWELQRRQRIGAPNWRAANYSASNQEKFKRGYFVEWRAADRHKSSLIPKMDFILDTTRGCQAATMLAGKDFRSSLRSLTDQPFRVVPFFDPGVWGGQWMRTKFHLEDGPPNFAWCFDCVPEENSLLFSSGEQVLEFPAMNLVLSHPRELLGEIVFENFGAEFPIRFDMLDTVNGQNLSLQVHPLEPYIKDRFGMSYTQDESYYILDASEESTVYLGVKTGVDRAAMIADLYDAAGGGAPFPASKYINQFPVKKHDHVSIPAGTVHCSGAETMVLEISATPYIFTFKLWDWDRVDLNGKPRPIHLEHGLANIQWERDTAWSKENLLAKPQVVIENPEFRDEITGLHALEFIESRRCWFADKADLNTHNTVTVMTLVDGDIIEIVSPGEKFPAFTLRYGETVIIPASVGAYTLQRSPFAESSRFAAVRAFVRGTDTSI